MSMKYARGATLVEVVLGIVVLAIAAAGVLSAFTLVRGSADPVVEKQLLAIAEGLMDEVTSRSTQTGSFTPTGSCPRHQFDDLHDYHNYQQSSYCLPNGNVPVGGADFAVSIDVSSAANVLGPSGATVPNAWRITVVVTHTPSNRSLSLIGYRTAWDQ